MTGLRLQIEAAIRECTNVPHESVEALAIDSRPHHLQDECPRCGYANVVCCHADLGGSLDYRDQFLHVCLTPACGFAKYVQQTSHVGHESLDEQLCPFCGRDAVTEGGSQILPRQATP